MSGAFSPVPFRVGRGVARDAGRCAMCGGTFGQGAPIVAVFSDHYSGRIVHARSHRSCPFHLRLVRGGRQAA